MNNLENNNKDDEIISKLVKSSVEFKKRFILYKILLCVLSLTLSLGGAVIKMTGDRIENFKLAYESFAKKWRSGVDVPPSVQDYIAINGLDFDDIDAAFVQKVIRGASLGGVGLTIHEVVDGSVMLIPTKIHSAISHVGGFAFHNDLSSMPENLKNIIREAIKK